MVNVNCGACGHLNSKGYCSLTACIFPCSFGTGGYINKPITNADRIRSMTDEELARFLDNHGRLWGADIVSTADDWLDWLKEEAKGD